MTATAAVAPAGGSGFATERLYRLMTLALGAAGVVEFASVAVTVPAQTPAIGTWYTAAAVAAVLAPAVAGIILFPRAPVRVLRRLWRVQSVAMLLALAGLVVRAGGPGWPRMGLTWIGELVVVAGCAAILAWPVRIAVGYAAVSVAAMVAVAVAAHPAAPLQHRTMGDAARLTFYTAMFMAMAGALFRASRMLDATVDRAVGDARAAAGARRRRDVRQRVDMLVHDSVIVALLAYASAPGTDRAAAEARRAQQAVAAARRVPVDAAVPAQTLIWQLQALTTRLDPAARFEYLSEYTGVLPGEVVTAVTEAFSEALRNSIRHAPQHGDVARQVHAEADGTHVRIVVLDDGDGFAPDAVAPARVGVRHGIVGRMDALPGGRADVRSTVGRGTTVLLEWSRG